MSEKNTETFMLKQGEWRAIWKGQLSSITFNSKGAAEAYIETCNKAGKLRS